MAEAGNGSDLTGAKVLLSVIAGIVLIALFVLHALRLGDRALVDVRLFRDRTFSLINIAFFTYVGALFGMMVLLPLYFQVVKHQTPLHSGLMTAPLGLGAMLTMPISGKLSDRIGTRRIVVVGLPVMLLGVFGYTQIHVDTATWLLLGTLFVLGLGHGTMMPALMGGMYRTMDRKDVPSGTVAANITMRVGSSIGVAAIAVVLQLAIQDAFPQTDGSLGEVARAVGAGPAAANAETLLTHAFSTSFWWAFGFAAFSILPVLLIPKTRQATQAPAAEETVAVP
jgi:MFS family permease